MRRVALMLVAGFLLSGFTAYLASASAQAENGGGQVSGIKIPPGYRDWRLIAVAHEEGKLNDLRAILGNDIAFNTAREGRLPYPDGSIIARLAWSYDPLPESAKAFGHLQSYVAGPPINGVQFMIKDLKKYGSTGGWAFVQFNNGNPVNVAMPGSCFSCHETVEARDFVFSRYAP